MNNSIDHLSDNRLNDEKWELNDFILVRYYVRITNNYYNIFQSFLQKKAAPK